MLRDKLHTEDKDSRQRLALFAAGLPLATPVPLLKALAGAGVLALVVAGVALMGGSTDTPVEAPNQPDVVSTAQQPTPPPPSNPTDTPGQARRQTGTAEPPPRPAWPRSIRLRCVRLLDASLPVRRATVELRACTWVGSPKLAKEFRDKGRPDLTAYKGTTDDNGELTLLVDRDADSWCLRVQHAERMAVGFADWSTELQPTYMVEMALPPKVDIQVRSSTGSPLANARIDQLVFDPQIIKHTGQGTAVSGIRQLGKANAAGCLRRLWPRSSQFHKAALLQVSAPGHAPRRYPLQRSWLVEGHVTLDVTLETMPKHRAVVVDRAGRPVAGVKFLVLPRRHLATVPRRLASFEKTQLPDVAGTFAGVQQCTAFGYPIVTITTGEDGSFTFQNVTTATGGRLLVDYAADRKRTPRLVAIDPGSVHASRYHGVFEVKESPLRITIDLETQLELLLSGSLRNFQDQDIARLRLRWCDVEQAQRQRTGPDDDLFKRFSRPLQAKVDGRTFVVRAVQAFVPGTKYELAYRVGKQPWRFLGPYQANAKGIAVRDLVLDR